MNTILEKIITAYLFLSLLVKIRVASSTAAGQETLIGIQGHDFILIGADSSSSTNSISFTTSSMDKIHVILQPTATVGRKNEEEKTHESIEDHACSKQNKEQQAIVVAAAGDIADCDYVKSMLSSHAKLREFEAGPGSDVNYIFNGNGEEIIDGSSYGLDASAIAHLARSEISFALRRSPLKVCLLIAGMVPHNTHEENDETIRKDKYSSSLLSKRIQTQITTALTDILPQPSAAEQENKIHSSSQSPCLKPHLYWLDEYGSSQKIPYGVQGYASNFALSILDQRYKPNMSKKDAALLIKDCFCQLRTRYVINSVSSKPCVKCIDQYGVETYEADEFVEIASN